MNTAYLISPELTLRTSPAATAFFAAINETLQEFIGVSILRNVTQLLVTEPDAGDAVVIFNREHSSCRSLSGKASKCCRLRSRRSHVALQQPQEQRRALMS